MNLKKLLPWIGLDSLGLWLTRRLLAVWVKTTVIPDDPATLGLNPGQPVFYILETRSLSNLLVLEQECLRLGLTQPTAALVTPDLILPRSVSAIQRWSGFFRRRPSRRSYSHTLLALMAAAAVHSDLDVQLVPVSVFWGRSPDKERSGFKLMFSDTWSKVGHLRRFFIILAHGRRTWIQFGRPVSLRAFADDSAATRHLSPELAVRKLCRVLRVYFRQRRQAAIGPDLSSRHRLVDELLRNPALHRAIAAEADRKSISPLRAGARARRYAYEIAADFSYPFILLMRQLLRRLWNRLYDGIEVNHVDRLQWSAPGHTVVYLPCHRSHIDYLLLSYVLHAQGLAIPHIAAGINLNIPLIGPLLRRGGAFFLRRSFKGNRLYAIVFHTYVSALLSKGMALEYFVEGGRSRSGFSLKARPGMLDMTVRSFLTQPRERPLMLVPVYIGYEKLVEGRAYAAELGGRSKQKESLLGFFRSLRMLRSRFGKVHVNFGEALLLEALLDRQQPGWRDETLQLEQRPDWLPPLVDELGREVMTRINSAADINPVSLLALVLLAEDESTLAEDDLAGLLDLCRALLLACPYSDRMTLTRLDGRQIIDYSVAMGVAGRLPGSTIRLARDSAILCRYFRNNILHVFVLAGLIARALPPTSASASASAKAVPAAAIIAGCREHYPALREQLFLRWSGQDLDRALQTMLTGMTAAGLLREQSASVYRRSGAVLPEHCLRLLGQSLQPLLSEAEQPALRSA